jgi:DNA-binding transcriptional LysR family regulator
MSLFEDMGVFTAVVEARSFTGAAARLGVAKSVVSRRIADLEERLGVSLFHRTTRRLSLTESGAAFYDRTVRILADVADAQNALKSLQGELVGKLRIGAPMSFGTMHLAGALDEFLAAHPEVEIDLDLNDRRVDLVSEGFDVAIRIGHLPDSSLIMKRLAPCRANVCASPRYLAEHGTPATPEDLASGHTCLIYSNISATGQWRFIVDGKERYPAVLARRFSVNNGEVLRDAAIAGLGLVVLPTFITWRALARGELEVVLADYEVADPGIHAIWAPGRHLSAKVRALVDFLAARFGPEPYWDKAA